MWYGFWWTQPEDFGYATGIIVKNVFDVNFEQFLPSEPAWICPSANYFDSRETYDGWSIGKWSTAVRY